MPTMLQSDQTIGDFINPRVGDGDYPTRWAASGEMGLNQVRDVDSQVEQQTAFRIPRLGGRRVSSSSLLLAINQLTVMTQNGIDVTEALATVAINSRNPVLSEKLQRVHDLVNSGSSLSAALAANSRGLPATMPAMISAAEATGQVPAALARLSKLMRAELQLKSTITGALIYPVVLILVSIAVVFAMLFGVLPQFGNVFENLGRPVPASTEVLLTVGRWAREQMWLCIGVIALMPVAGYFSFSHPKARFILDYVMLWTPGLSHAYRPLITGRMFRLLGSMLSGGIPLLDAVRLTRHSMRNSYLVQLLEDVERDVLAGDMAHRAFHHASFLPAEAAQMVATAERTGRLADVLNDCGEFYEEQGERLLRKLVHSLEPVIILGMGVLVAGVVLSIMLPLLDISSVA